MLRWSNNEPFERSPRIKKKDQNIDLPINTNIDNQAQRNSMLEYDWTMQGTMQGTMHQHQELFSSNKREDTYNKMAEREPICQISQNPFMPNSSFADVVNNLQQNIPLVKEKREEKREE